VVAELVWQGEPGLAQNGSSVEQHAEMATRKVGFWIERLARVGYLVYVLVGGLALRTAFGEGDQVTGHKGTLRSILLAPLGRGLLFMVALGLLAYAAWRLFQGVMDPEDKGREAKGIVQCFDHLINGFFHAALAQSAGQLAPGSGGRSGGSPDDWTANPRFLPFGRWLVVVVGAAIFGAGLYQFYKVYKTDFRDELKTGDMSFREKRWMAHAGRLSYAARGVVFEMIGVFLVQAALQADPDEHRGLGSALETLARQPLGLYILCVVAAGLVAYGAFMFVMARYRRIEPA
jgi:hypothetical protein